ncbi:DNA topoisomerase IB [Altererythrobacter sp. H2]|uniref:DNA topoisomerase IB n=1 Tax=Altererythrobacter sp. H2 TaxID=3108391 RepID=UPI002B4BE61C|nr:DNA topoisomerase IB [Altererythrobacter sp. H2]WRK96866.1 DNA topoisomerase IB [Altererythrobacter sp. H2]
MAKPIYVDDSLPGITRKRAGRGWAYYAADGALVTDPAEKRRLNAVALPPAYIDAWFCPAPNGHILATGYDARGRKQYRYHPEFRAAREGEKFDGCARFGALLPLVRKRVEEDLSARSLTCERAVASVIRLLDLGAIRIGNECYARDNRSFGATTLRKRHADVTGRTLRLRYKGKSGQVREVRLTDAALVRVVRRMEDLPGQNLFQYVDDAGDVQAVGSHDVNTYLRETMGQGFTAKNFRTWHGSVIALSCLLDARGEPLSLKEVLASVSERLGNTPAVARRSYIHPAVIDRVGRNPEAEPLALPRATRWLSREERALLALLAEHPTAQDLLAA